MNLAHQGLLKCHGIYMIGKKEALFLNCRSSDDLSDRIVSVNF